LEIITVNFILWFSLNIIFMKTILRDYLPILPTKDGVPGHGQGLLFKGQEYYYACETGIPKDRAISLVRYGNKRKSHSWIIVVWDEESDGYVLIEDVNKDLMHRIKRYKGVSTELLLTHFSV